MGLDMYLSAKRYIGGGFNEAEGKVASAVQEQFPELNGLKSRWGDASVVNEVKIEAGYWRKANQIHDWFVKNVQGGEDECRPHYVPREKLVELKELCEKVLADRSSASTDLPTASGFFFGSTDYDEYYYEDIRSTIEIIDRCLELPANWDFEYCSSW